MRVVPFFALSLLCLASQAQEMAVNLPLDLEHPAVSGDARLARQADGTILWTLPPAADSATLDYDLAALGIVANAFDELRIEFRTEASLAAFEPRLLAYPVNDMCRNWYSKSTSNRASGPAPASTCGSTTTGSSSRAARWTRPSWR